MADQTLSQSVEVEAGSHAKEDQSILSPELNVLILTWVVFFALLAILYKFAWKPILTALDAREDYIRKSLEQADAAKKQFEEISQQSAKLLAEADQKAKEVVNRASKAAHDAAKTIEEKAKQETQILLENAQREIKAQTQKAEAELRQKSAEIAVALTQKILDENLDESGHRRLVDKLIKEI